MESPKNKEISSAKSDTRKPFLKGLLTGGGAVAAIGALVAYQAVSVAKDAAGTRGLEIQAQISPIAAKIEKSASHLRDIRKKYEKISTDFGNWKGEMLTGADDLKNRVEVFTTDAAKKKALIMGERYLEVNSKKITDKLAAKDGWAGTLGKMGSSFLKDSIAENDAEDTLANDPELSKQWNDFVAAYKKFESKAGQGLKLLDEVQNLGKDVETLGAEGQSILDDAQILAKEIRDMDLQLKEFKRVLFKEITS